MNIRCDEIDGLAESVRLYLGFNPWRRTLDNPWFGGMVEDEVIPLRVPAAIRFLEWWLEEGERCSQCHGNVPDWMGCARCAGLGWLRKPVPHARDFRPYPDALADCVRRVGRGERPLLGVLPE